MSTMEMIAKCTKTLTLLLEDIRLAATRTAYNLELKSLLQPREEIAGKRTMPAVDPTVFRKAIAYITLAVLPSVNSYSTLVWSLLVVSHC